MLRSEFLKSPLGYKEAGREAIGDALPGVLKPGVPKGAADGVMIPEGIAGFSVISAVSACALPLGFM